jgi:hypothetical protein
MLATLSFVLLWTVTAVAATEHQHEHALKVGKKGEITLTEPTKVGGRTLQPDTYVVQHRTSKDGGHFVRFLELKQVREFYAEPGWMTYVEQDNAGEIKCRVEPAPRVNETTVFIVTENGQPRITKVAIKGEDFVHLF